MSRAVKLARFLLIPAALAFMSACTGTGSPESTVAVAAAAVKSGDLRAFVATLEGRALQQYGNVAGIAEIAGRLGNSDLAISEVLIVRDDDVRVRVIDYANGALILTAIEKCEWTRILPLERGVAHDCRIIDLDWVS
jgi:hypothetical protein